MDRVKDEYAGGSQNIPSVPTVDRWLRDSFYCGQWVIMSWSKKERVIDLLSIELPDGTRFTPVLSVEEFKLIQNIRRGNRATPNVKRKRTNPLPKMVTCWICGSRMYPNYRKITKAAWV